MIYIDCTSTHSIDMLTGIQRVVYNVVEKCQQNQDIAHNIQPVVLSSRGFLPITSLQKHRYTTADTRDLDISIKKEKSSVTWIELLKIRKFPFLYQIIRKIFFALKRKKIAKILKEPNIIFNKNDTLLFLDACWNMPIWSEVKKAKIAGARIVFIIYDLIPIHFPEFCDKPHTNSFKNFFLNSLNFADMYVGISQTVMEEVKVFALHSHHQRARNIKYDYFYLGSDFSQNIVDDKVRREIKDFFEGKTPVFLTVSTIEPRKNHALILNAFDSLWEKGIDVKLCFIGKIGWKIAPFIEKIKSHRMLGKKFMVFYNANDFELSYAYTNAHSLVFASFVEGFGLPIIEALNCGLPVLASSLPIHKEIGRDNIDYFQLDNMEELVYKLEKLAQEPKKILKSTWMTWDESINMLLNKIV